MKNLTFIALLVFIGFVSQLFLPWWIIVVISFVICYIFNPNKFNAFTGSFIAIFLLWLVKAYVADQNFDVPMSGLLAGLMGNISSGGIFFLTGLIGGLTAGLGGLLGTWTRQLSQY